MNKQSKLIKVQELSELLSLANSTIRRWCCQRKIPYVRMSARAVRFDLDKISAWARDHEIEERKLKNGR